MITSLYIDNYRCFSNFEVKFDRLTTFLGPNGSGKSACMEALVGLRDFMTGNKRSYEFAHHKSRTRWDSRPEQTFELRVALGGGEFRYRLVIVHQGKRPLISPRSGSVKEEVITFDEHTILRADESEVVIEGTAPREELSYQPDGNTSALARMPSGLNVQLTMFRGFIKSLLIVAPTPALVGIGGDHSDTGEFLAFDSSNFPAFLKYLNSSRAPVVRKAEGRLRAGLVEGLVTFQTPTIDDFFLVECVFEGADGKELKFRLRELSAGQIAAVILHIATAYAEAQGGCLVLDEPGNFLAVAELQPFLDLWKELALEKGGQVILATHHPIAIDYLAGTHGLWFDREATGPARNPVKIHLDDDAADSDAYLRVSDLIARGWLSGLGLNSAAD